MQLLERIANEKILCNLLAMSAGLASTGVVHTTRIYHELPSDEHLAWLAMVLLTCYWFMLGISEMFRFCFASDAKRGHASFVNGLVWAISSVLCFIGEILYACQLIQFR